MMYITLHDRVLKEFTKQLCQLSLFGALKLAELNLELYSYLKKHLHLHIKVALTLHGVTLLIKIV